MGPAQAVQLDAVLEGPQESVRRSESRCVITPDIPPDGESFEGDKGGGASQHDVAAAMDKLKELDGELHIAQTAWTELQLAIPKTRRHMLLDPAAHGLHVFDESRMIDRPPNKRCDSIDIPATKLEIPSRWPGLEQRLELPGLRPALVIADMRLNRPNERPLLTLRSQSRVDLPDRPL